MLAMLNMNGLRFHIHTFSFSGGVLLGSTETLASVH